MVFKLLPATISDLEAAKSVYGPETGDLAAAAASTFWTVEPVDLAAARRRAAWSCQQQIDLMSTDPTTRFVKVVDTDKSGEIVALGRWHEYPHGYVNYGDQELVGSKDRNDPATWPEGLNKAFYIGVLDAVFQGRGWMGKEHCWVLTNIVTREPYRRQGAGGLILQWGLEQAKKDGVSAYLEAAVTAKHLYETHGFKQVEAMKFDCSPYGMPGVVFEFSRMKADP